MVYFGTRYNLTALGQVWSKKLFFGGGGFRATPVAYGSSQALGWIGATAAGLHHSLSNARCKQRLWPTPQLTATPDPHPLSKARVQTSVLMDISWIRFHWAPMRTPAQHFKMICVGCQGLNIKRLYLKQWGFLKQHWVHGPKWQLWRGAA